MKGENRMVNMKSVVTAVLTTFCLTLLFTTIPTRSLPSGLSYDSWMDINDDGKIDMKDIGNVAARFMTAGEPINKTALLLELQSKIDALNTTIIEQQNTINNLENTVLHLNETVVHLNDTIAELNNTLTLVWDSGWYGITIGGDQVFYHNLGLDTSNIVVYMVGKKSLSDPPHQTEYGGDYTGTGYQGAYWTNLTPNTITFHRNMNDLNWLYVRFTLWKRVTT